TFTETAGTFTTTDTVTTTPVTIQELSNDLTATIAAVTEGGTISVATLSDDSTSLPTSSSGLTYQWQIESGGTTSFTHLTAPASTSPLPVPPLLPFFTFTEPAGTFTTTDTVTTTPVTIQELSNDLTATIAAVTEGGTISVATLSDDSTSLPTSSSGLTYQWQI